MLYEATARLRQVFTEADDPLPASLDAFDVYTFDGHKLKHVAKRLKALWRLNGQILTVAGTLKAARFITHKRTGNDATDVVAAFRQLFTGNFTGPQTGEDLLLNLGSRRAVLRRR